MGNSCSDASTASRPLSADGSAPVGADGTQEQEERRLAQLARDANEKWFQENRLNYSKFLAEAGAHAGEAQLLVCTLAPAVFSATVDTFRPWCSVAGNGGSVACSMSASNVNFGASMLKNMIRLIAAITSAGDGMLQPNTPPSDSQLMNVLQFKDTWRRLLDASAVQSFEHPYLGMVAIVQPLLMNCLVARLMSSDDELEDLVQLMLEHGGHASVPNSLGVTPLMACMAAVIMSLVDRRSGSSTADADLSVCRRALAIARRLVEAGANAAATTWPFGPDWRLGAHATGVLYAVEPLLQRPVDRPFCALEALDELLLHHGLAQSLDGSEAGALVAELRALLHPRLVKQPRMPVVLPEPLPWTQAIFNILWAVSQVTGVAGSRQRSAALERVREESPFTLPPLMFCPATKLQRLGHIPRYACQTQNQVSRAWEPTPASELPEDAVTVFISHRWLGNGCPDDEQGTKLKQVLQAAELVAQLKGVSLDRVYLWIDWASVDQNDPMPGVKALPMYIACCDLFVYLDHPEYFERAWCLTEQFVFWKVCHGQQKYFFGPASVEEAPSLQAKANDKRPPEPARGKLSCEAERVALATLAAIMADGDV